MQAFGLANVVLCTFACIYTDIAWIRGLATGFLLCAAMVGLTAPAPTATYLIHVGSALIALRPFSEQCQQSVWLVVNSRVGVELGLANASFSVAKALFAKTNSQIPSA